jgi:general secretion pathway protein D
MTNLLEQSTKDVLRAVVRDPAFSLAARKKNYELSIIERPSIRLLSGQEGTIDVDSRIPVITATASSSGFVSEQVTYVNSGIEINAGARVTQDGKILLNMNITTSNLVKLVASPSGSSAPQLSSREIQTTLTIRDGETALIGGISSFKNAADQDGIPGLAKSKYTTPFGGRLSGDQVRNELLMFVTPELVSETQIASRSLMGISGGAAAASFMAAPTNLPPPSAVGGASVN